MFFDIDGFWDPLCALLDHMQELQFIRTGLEVKYLVAGQVEDILPMLHAADAKVSESEKTGRPETVERL